MSPSSQLAQLALILVVKRTQSVPGFLPLADNKFEYFMANLRALMAEERKTGV